MLKQGFVFMAPGADSNLHNATLITPEMEMTVIGVPYGDIKKTINVCKEMVEIRDIKSIILCPSHSLDDINKIKEEIGKEIALTVAAGDEENTALFNNLITENKN